MAAAASVPFVPRATAQAFVPSVKKSDDIMYTALTSLSSNEYYIKGGKAFEYYYPDKVPSSDYDLVATNEVCTELFAILEKLLLGTNVKMDEYEPFFVKQINSTDDTWKDVVRGARGEKKKITHRVRSFHINGIGLVDVIIVDSVLTDTEQVVIAENGLQYMNRALFKKDLDAVYKDRARKINFPQWDKTSDKYKKLFTKYRKSSERLALFKGKKTRKRSRRIRRNNK